MKKAINLVIKNWRPWIVILLAIGLVGYFIDAKQNTSGNLTDSETSKQKEVATIIYDKNEAINSFLNNYNKANPTDLIKSDMFQPYYHHGSVHDNQIIFENKADFEIVISGKLGNKVEIFISSLSGKTKSENDYKTEFTKFTKALDEHTTEEDVNYNWQKILSDNTNHSRFEKFEASLTINQQTPSQLVIRQR